MARKTAYFLPSLAHIFFTIFFLILIGYGDILLGDADTGYHIRAGEYILDKMSIPRADIFSHLDLTPPWTAHEWLAEVIMALMHGAMGLTGVVIFFSALIAITFSLFFKLLRLNHNHIILLWLVASFATICTTIHWLARPHAFCFLFLVLWYFILGTYQNDKKNCLYFLPVIMLAWVNLHGGSLLSKINENLPCSH